jgi:hypothetical protein
MPPCDHCRQPWAHGLDGPPVKRDVGKVIVLAVLGGVAAQILFIVLAAYVYVGLSRQSSTVLTYARLPAGPLRPAFQACALFDRWEATTGANTNLLNRAVADAHSPRVPRQSKLHLRTDLSGLRNGIREATYAHSLTTAVNYEHAVRADCAPIMAANHHVRRHHHGPRRPRLGQTSTMRSAIIRAVRPHHPAIDTHKMTPTSRVQDARQRAS